MVKIILPWGKEDYNWMYGKLNYKDKTIVEIGADMGSTAVFFLNKGVKKVISVERDENFYQQLVENFKDDNRVVPIKMDIMYNYQIEWLLLKYRPDILHMDCEGCEEVLMRIDDKIFKIPDAFQIEIHHHIERYNKFIEKFNSLGYKITHDIKPQGEKSLLWVVNAVRENRKTVRVENAK